MPDDGMTTLLFWDIDGTLLTTGRAGIFAWEAAASEIAGEAVDLQKLSTAGLTDFAVGRAILDCLGLSMDDASLARIVRRYEERLPAALPRRPGRVLEGVRDVLQFVSDERSDIGLYLLTGNTQDGARAKLTHYGLFDFFAGGAFATATGDRTEIARRALAGATNGRSVPLERVFVIGDTPHDVRCGRAIGAKTVAVASGDYSVDMLQDLGPWRTLEVIPPVETFLAMLEDRA